MRSRSPDGERHRWRLRVTLDAIEDWDDVIPGLEDDDNVVLAVGAEVSCDEDELFVYTAERSTLDAARETIDAALHQKEETATTVVCQWDEHGEEWLQVDPPPTVLQAAAARRSPKVETRTIVCSVGPLLRTRWTAMVSYYAEQLGLECSVQARRRFVSTQMTLTVAGRKRAIDDFEELLRDEADPGIRLGY